MGQLARMQKRIRRLDALAVALPSWMQSWSGGMRSGRPSRWSLDLIAHHPLPGGPRCARDQLVQGVPIQTPMTSRGLIQPSMRVSTRGLVRSYSGPMRISKARHPKPSRRTAVDRP